jgi:TonB family protein
MRCPRLAVVIVIAVCSVPLLGRGQNGGESARAPAIRLLSAATPAYPASAKSNRIMGEVRVEAVVESDGHVSDARVTRSIPLLDAAALAAVHDWRFASLPASTAIEVAFEFTLDSATPARVRSSLWTSPSSSPDDAAVFSFFCGHGDAAIEFVSEGGSPIVNHEPESQRVSLSRAEVAAIHELARANLAAFEKRFDAWRDIKREMRLNVQGRQVSAVVSATAPLVAVCNDSCNGSLDGLYLRHAGVWTELSHFVQQDGKKPLYREQFKNVDAGVRAIARENESFRSLPPSLRSCIS